MNMSIGHRSNGGNEYLLGKVEPEASGAHIEIEGGDLR